MRLTVGDDQGVEMNERTLRDRFHALGPLVLRVGIAAVLMGDGLNRIDGFFQPDPVAVEQSEASTLTRLVTAATPDGVQFGADWGSMLGAGELGAAGLLVIGLVTRLVVLPILGVIGYGLFAGFTQASMPTNDTTMWLLGAACVSLLTSGSGCFAPRLRRRKVIYQEVQPKPKPPISKQEFAYAKPPLTQRVKQWFNEWRSSKQPAAQIAAAASTRRWPWRRIKV